MIILAKFFWDLITQTIKIAGHLPVIHNGGLLVFVLLFTACGIILSLCFIWRDVDLISAIFKTLISDL